MKRSLRFLAVAALIIFALPIHGAVAPAAPKFDTEGARGQLSAYFADIARNSPTVLGGLAESPETMDAIQKKIASMSDEELGRFQALMVQAPDWKIAPEALAHAFPPELLEQMRRVGKDYSSRAPRGEEMRDEVRTLITVLKLLPDEKLKELGVDRTMVASLETTFAEMTTLQAAMLHRKAGENASWDAKSAAAIKELPPALQRGAAALSEKGLLTESDLTNLDAFRNELVTLLDRIEKLPPGMQKKLNLDQFRIQVEQLRQATPDVLFMVHHNIPSEMLTALEENVSAVERIANLSDGEKRELEQFRGELAATFKSLDENRSGDDETSLTVDQMLSQLEPQELLILRRAMGTLGNWQTTLPAFYGTLSSPELQTRLQLINGPTPDPVAVNGLETFRGQMLIDADHAKTLPGADVALIEKARSAVEGASLQRLEIMRLAVEKLPAEATVIEKLGIGAMSTDFNFNCSVDMPSPVPDISLDFICNPIEDALQAVKNGIVSTVNSIVASVRSALETTISTVSSALTSAINTVTSTVNSIISSISNLANQISSFIQTIPTLAWNLIKSALDLLLNIEIRNGVTLRNLLAEGAQQGLTSMKNLLGLAEGWWTAISTFTLPAIPCPPTGFHTPFGDVGDGAASDNYGRYRLVIDGIIDMIPDTETSLAIKIPAQVLYLMFDFLGECLEQAASAADSAEAASRHTIVLANFSSLQAYVGSQIAGLSAQNTGAANELLALVNQQSAATNATMLGESLAIQSRIDNHSTSIQNLIDSESTEIQTLLQSEGTNVRSDLEAFQTLNVRLIIERVLQQGTGHELATLELLRPLGYLELVRDIVETTLNAMDATQNAVGQARRYYDGAVRLMNTGKEKDAFREFAKAYREATK